MKRLRLLSVITFGLILSLVLPLSVPTPALAVAPTVTSATPDNGDQGQSLSVTIAGTDFTGASSVSFGPEITVDSFAVDDSTQITANIAIDAGAAVGARDVSVTNIDGIGTLVSGFTVNQAPPEITSVRPNQGIQGQTENVTITGNYFTGATSVDFGAGITTNSFVVTPSSGPAEVQVGTGTMVVDYPFYTYYMDARTQSILLASEIGQPGEIQKLSLYCSRRPSRDLSHFYIRMQHTTMTSFPSTSYVNSGWTTVLHATNVDKDIWTVPGWVEFEFTTPFDYDGVSNLLIDYCFDNSAWTSPNGQCHATSTATYRTLDDHHDYSSTDMLNHMYGYRQTYYNNVRLVFHHPDTIDANITIDGAATPGYRDVSVTTPEGTNTEADGFMVVATPTLSSVSPSEADQGQALSVAITGANLFGVTTVGFGSGITVNSFTVDNNTQITASIAVSGSATVGTRDVSVTNAAGTATLISGFTVNQAPPTISSVNPDQGVPGQTLDVTISGNYFTGTTSVDFGADITVNGFTVDSSAQITANITIDGSATLGLRDVSVTTPEGTATLTNGFAVLVIPIISSVSPGEALQGEALDVTIAGAHFLGATDVGFGSGVTVNSFIADNDTQITASITVDMSAAAGSRDVSVTNADGTGTLAGGFTVTQAPPVVTSVSPNQGTHLQTYSVTITGEQFNGVTAVDFGDDIAVNGFTVDSETQITATIHIGGTATVGPKDVSVTTPGGTATLTDGFTVPGMPTVSSVSPNQAVQGQTLSVTITGTNFYGVTSVEFGSRITINSFTVDSGTQITANITVDPGAEAGPRDVKVTNIIVGWATLAGGFTVNQAPPGIISVNPQQAPQGQTLDVTVTGSYFTGATSVDFGPDITVNSYNISSSAHIVANITIGGSAIPGPRDISVTTPAGTATMTDGLTVLSMPTISSVSPNQAVRGQVLTVTITGTNFLGATAVGFGTGIVVNSFTVNNSGEIVAEITVGANATIGPRDVSVTTPGVVGRLAGGFAVVVPSPDIASLTPDSGRRGDKLEVTISGANFTGATEVTFGEGVTVDSFTVDSATQITAQISIAANAAKGTRDVSVSTPQVSGTMSDGFQVQAKAGAIPLYFWLLVPGMAAVGLLVLAFVIRRKKKEAAAS